MEIWLCQTCGMVQEHDCLPVDPDESSTDEDRYRVPSCEEFAQPKADNKTGSE